MEEKEAAYNKLYQEKMQGALQNIETNANRVSAFTFAANAPILTASNLLQFGKVFGREYYANKRFWQSLGTAFKAPQEMAVKGSERIVGEAGKAVLKGAGKAGTWGNIGKTIIKNAFTEGI
jgi:hypothetical protein